MPAGARCQAAVLPGAWVRGAGIRRIGAAIGAGGGLGGDTTVSSALKRLLEQDAASYTWVAATEGSQGGAR